MALLLKLLLVIAVVLLLFGWVRRPRRATAPPPSAPVRMLACAECGVHVPQSEALIARGDGAAYCSPAHRAAGDRRCPPAPR